MPRGGKRDGAGRPKGSPNASTITKEQARLALREVVLAHMEELVSAQMENAKGLKHLMLRDPKTGKFERVAAQAESREVAEAQIDAALSTGSAFYVFTKDPSVQAFTDLMNRALDKPKEQEQEIRVSGDSELVAALIAGRKRVAEAG